MVADIGLEEYKYGFITEDSDHVYKARPGLSEQVVRDISAHKGEPEWMLEFRLKALETYYSKPMPKWGGDLETLDKTLDEI
jgi:Fe-S cluster assembly protein SufB